MTFRLRANFRARIATSCSICRWIDTFCSLNADTGLVTFVCCQPKLMVTQQVWRRTPHRFTPSKRPAPYNRGGSQVRIFVSDSFHKENLFLNKSFHSVCNDSLTYVAASVPCEKYFCMGGTRSIGQTRAAWRPEHCALVHSF
jgi:hypothetical protein